MQIMHLDPHLGEIIGQLFGHALGQSGDQNSSALPLDRFFDFDDQIRHLAGGRPDLNFRIEQAGRPDQLGDVGTICSASYFPGSR